MKIQDLEREPRPHPDFDKLDAQLKASAKRLSRAVRQCEENHRKPRKKKTPTVKQ